MADTEFEKAKLDPSTLSLEYRRMMEQWDKINTVLGGTAAMRKAGRKFLPIHEAESDDAYTERLESTVLVNYSKLTLNSWVGRPFSKKVKLSDDRSDRFFKFSKDVDLCGNNIDVFCRNWFKSGVSKRIAYVMVDFPRTTTEGRVRTLADDKRENVRPYFIPYQAEDVLFAHKTRFSDGEEYYDHVRIHKTELIKEGFAERLVERIEVWEPKEVRVYEKVKKTNDKVEWVLKSKLGWSYDLDFVPLVLYESDTVDSPLLDIADLNITHWQSSSDQRSILTVARFPMLAVSGTSISEAGKMVVGPKHLLATKESNGKFYFVEHAGKSIGAGQEDMKSLEEQMGNYGADFLKKSPGSPTATARALDSVESTSPLQDMVIRFQDAVNLAIYYCGQWERSSSEDWDTEVEINSNFSIGTAESASFAELGNSRGRRDISRRAYIEEMIRRGELQEDFDYDKNNEELSEELKKEFETLIPTDPNKNDE